MFAWYAVQVHQTKYLVEIGFSRHDAAWALGFVSLVAVPGQIWLGHLSDRIGRESIWTVGSLGFAICYSTLLVMAHAPTPTLLYLMVVSQGFLGYSLTSVIGAIPAEIFEGRHYGTISERSGWPPSEAGQRAPGSPACCTTRPRATRWPSGSRLAVAGSRRSPSGWQRRVPYGPARVGALTVDRLVTSGGYLNAIRHWKSESLIDPFSAARESRRPKS
jgi:hypothetical protein